ncbi:PDZ domain-containing protein [archaeon]|jgi:preprotein translocase subunit SecD|nr:PDZ domain-containing protein [archaeon]MBT4373092.1 PDZ domain-containing protein [archaeon]MBT4531437.1 PDZ domain-containing protein [archaeon]MBT7001385.1 PDZ domain-containing protein [archaeon]MBT7282129.1 PDZ domain-containing protein [archaeon]
MKLTIKIWLLIIALLFSLLAILGNPFDLLQSGVVITSVDQNSTSFEQGIRQGQIITEIDGQQIESLEDFSKILSKKDYTQENIKTIIKTSAAEHILFSNEAPKITVAEIPKTNVKLGLDLAGGSRALVKAQDKDLTSTELNDLINVVSNRLNVYGIADMKILPISDLAGNNFMLIEIAGATPKDLQELIGQQGKFEAKIGDEIAFIGGDKDVSSVCRNDATCAGIFECGQASDDSYYCNFRFAVYLSEVAAQKHADITQELEVNSTAQGNYLSKKLDLFLDDTLVDSLLIGESLKGRVTTQISISGAGTGTTRAEAYDVAEESMNKLQTILITGSLPYKLEIVKLDTISPVLEDSFLKSILLAGLAALIAVALVIFFRYKNVKFSLALILTSISEVIIILGIASFIEWNLDLPSIAGIIAGVGTGIDSQIIVLDEAKQETSMSLREKLKRAFKIILGSYFTSLVALLPLLWAGAGLLKGFAITTIIGITIGVFITRPAFTDIIRKIEE